MMNDSLFEIEAPGVDVQRVVEEVRATVAEKREKGLYTDACVARAERTNLDQLRDDEQFLEFYLECLRDAVFVDISDFEIFERRARFSTLLVALKKAIWKLLKFYTYRLWSQQNQVNGLLLSAAEATEQNLREKLGEMEARIASLENRNRPD